VTDPHERALSEFFLGPEHARRDVDCRGGALTELGRIAEAFGNEAAREVANTIYEKYRVSNRRPRTRDVVADLRNRRLAETGHKRPSGEGGLYQKLTRLIAEHRKLYPELTAHEIRMVLFRVHGDLSAEAEES